MNYSKQLTLKHLSRLSTIALMAGAWGILSTDLQAEDVAIAKPATTAEQRHFATPDEAVKALQVAAESKDQAAMCEIFGPECNELLTGDKVQDAKNSARLGAALAQGSVLVKDGENTVTVEVGTNNWPMPIPLVKVDGQWHFATALGKEEIIDRRIGKNEVHAISVCRAYVTAQRQYAELNPQAGGTTNYAQKFKSTAGKKDGLYWPTVANEAASPFGPLLAEAQAEGYGNSPDAVPHPFHGYLFRILTRQGDSAPDGKQNYVTEGVLSGGFALVAYPEKWDKSGIMTFIVNQDGKVFEKNLADKTSEIAAAMREYNPETGWTQVDEAGVVTVVSEQ
jgi:hypothetical protein